MRQGTTTANGASVLVVIPTYNEAENIEPLLAAVRKSVPGCHLLFVDDGSTDGTEAAIHKTAQAHAMTVEVMQRGRKLGLGTAYVAGFKWGLAKGYEKLIEMDADLSHDPADLPRLIEALDHSPVAIGSRYVEGGGTRNWNVWRRCISRFGGVYARLILGMPTQDLTGGFNGWQSAVLQAIGLDSVRSEGYGFQIELKYRAHLLGHQITELPIIFEERRLGKSKMSWHIAAEAMVRVLKLRYQVRFSADI